MRATIVFVTASLAFSAALGAAAAVKKKPAHHSTVAASSAHKTATSSARKKAGASHHSKHSRTSHHASATTWRNRQLEPSPDRYKEIQEALAHKGYLHEEATGKWDEESADALRRFQHDQNLDPSGKLNSLSLIALGLGPNHDAAAAPAPPQPPPAQP